MRLKYEIILCIIALCHSGAATQPRAPSPGPVLNTTTSLLPVLTTNSTKASTTTFHRTSNSTLSVCTPVTQPYGTSYCVSYCRTKTIFAFAPNATSTITALLTVYGNSTSFLPTTPPSIVTLPPQPCPTKTFACKGCKKPPPPPTTISLITSKTSTVTNLVTLPPVCFTCENDPGKVPVNGAASPTPADSDQPQILQQQTPDMGIATAAPTPAGDGDGNPSPTTVTVNGVQVGIPGPGSSIIIDGTPVVTPVGGGAATVTAAGGQVFTVDASQIIESGTTIALPIDAAGSSPTPTVVEGVTLAIGPSDVVIGGTTFTITPGATPTSLIVNGVQLSIGPGGVGFPSTTIFPAPGAGFGRIASATQAITAGGITFTEISSSLVVIGSSTFTIGPGATPTTDVVDGQTVSIGPNGVGFASTTVLYSPGTGSARPIQTGAGGLRYSYHWEILGMCMTLAVWFLV